MPRHFSPRAVCSCHGARSQNQGSSTLAPAYGSLLPLPSHRYHPQPTTSGLSASWQGTEVGRGDQRITGPAFSCHSSQDKLRDTNTCLPTHYAVMLLRACRTIKPSPSEAQSDSHQHWLHTLQASKASPSSRVLGGRGRNIEQHARDHPSCAKHQLQPCAVGPRETPWLWDLYALFQQIPVPCWKDT